MNNRPKVGVGVLLIRDSQILLGKRKNAHGDGTWAPPGGHLEFGESFENCARREVLEETGIEILSVKKGWFTNDIFTHEKKHYVTIFMLADTFYGDPQVREPEKCEAWAWFNINELPDRLFLPLRNLIEQEGSILIF